MCRRIQIQLVCDTSYNGRIWIGKDLCGPAAVFSLPAPCMTLQTETKHSSGDNPDSGGAVDTEPKERGNNVGRA